MKESDRHIGLLLHDAARLLRRHFHARTADMGLSLAQWRLLVVVFRDERPTQARIAERLEIEPISVSRLVDRMVEAGWVQRVEDPADRRIRLIEPTERALAAWPGVRARLGETIEAAFSGFSAAERAATAGYLERMITNLADGCQAENGKNEA